MTRRGRSLCPALGRPFLPRASGFPLQVFHSKIHGLGVFSRGPIPARQRVIEYVGQRITSEEAQKRWERMRTPGKPTPVYIYKLNGKCWIDGSVRGNGAEFINHSCAPNLRVRRIRGQIFLFSRKSVHAGEELTVDYRFPPDGERVECLCGSPKCRGTINRK